MDLEFPPDKAAVVRNKSVRHSRGHLLQRILVMTSAEDWLAQDDVPGGDAMATPIPGRRMLEAFRCSKTKAHVRPATLGLRNPLLQDPSQVVLVQRDHEVQAFSAECAAEALAYRVCLGRTHRRSQNSHSEFRHGLVRFRGEDAVPVVDHKTIRDDPPRVLRGTVATSIPPSDGR